MGMRTITLKFLDRMAEQGETRFSIGRLRVQLVNLSSVGRNEVTAYVKYLIDSGLLKEASPGIFEIDHELRLKLGGE